MTQVGRTAKLDTDQKGRINTAVGIIVPQTSQRELARC